MKRVVVLFLVAAAILGARYYARHRRVSKAEMKAEAVGRAIASGSYSVPSDVAETPPSSMQEAEAPVAFAREVELDAVTARERARARVQWLMSSWRNPRVAAAIWASGDLSQPADALAFERWQREKSLDLGVRSWTIGDVYRTSGDYTVVEVTINHARCRIGVPDQRRPLFWTAF